MNPATSNRALSRSAVIALACCLFILALGSRWALLAGYGTDLPEMDQWDAEGLALLQPAAQGQLHLASFLLPHNEHRIVLTRLVAFGLAQANGQWDQRLEAACNAVLPGALAVGLWLLGAPRLSGRWQVGYGAALAAVYALPLAWENILGGFDSQQFFLIGLAVAGIVWLPFAEPFRLRWWLGAASIVLSLGSMASGFFAAAIVAGLLTFQLERARRPLSSAVPGLMVCGGAIAIGVMSRVAVAGHESLKAQSVADFSHTLAKALGWPAFDFGWGYAGLLLFVPWALVAQQTLFGPAKVERDHPAPRSLGAGGRARLAHQRSEPARPEVALHPAPDSTAGALLPLPPSGPIRGHGPVRVGRAGRFVHPRADHHRAGDLGLAIGSRLAGRRLLAQQPAPPDLVRHGLEPHLLIRGGRPQDRPALRHAVGGRGLDLGLFQRQSGLLPVGRHGNGLPFQVRRLDQKPIAGLVHAHPHAGFFRRVVDVVLHPLGRGHDAPQLHGIGIDRRSGGSSGHIGRQER